MQPLTDKLQLWVDDPRRDGPHNMAIDEWLLATATEPVLRVYRWASNWGSLGYFVPHEEAEALHPDRQWVRRWTGGGIVDHTADWTYTVVIPGRKGLAGMKGGESYQLIHQALAKAVRAGGTEARLAGTSQPARGGDCFVQAVEFDLCDPMGRKIAGAGQRRSRDGLLHQGSLAAEVGEDMGERFAHCLSTVVNEVTLEPSSSDLAQRIKSRYGTLDWYQRR